MNSISWKDQAFLDQLSHERDFPQTRVRKRFAICCGHRTGSNLLGEALYKTGLAGDPMEYFNVRFLELYKAKKGITNLDVSAYLQEMEDRRTSPNGIFGINIKIDQLKIAYQENVSQAVDLIRNNDLVIFLYRKNKIRQAVSLYIGRAKDTYNTPTGVSDEEILEKVRSVPFNPCRIATCLTRVLQVDHEWLEFFNKNNIQIYPVAYEDFVDNYETYIRRILVYLGVPEANIAIPEQPLRKISNEINDSFTSSFLGMVNGELDYPMFQTGN